MGRTLCGLCLFVEEIMPDIQWYPGHMARARRLLTAQLGQVDAVVELCDARAPMATRNPDLAALTRGKARVLVLNKADLADDDATSKWTAFLRARGETALRFNSRGGKTKELLSVVERAVEPVVSRMKARGVSKTVRLMVIGIPNVGKSSFINRLYGSAVAKAADRPGVTRANQWVKVGPYLELLDTPGLLWPKLGDQDMARDLAFLGSVRDEIMDSEALAGQLLEKLMRIDEAGVRERFKLHDAAADAEGEALVEAACRGRGWLMQKGRPDTERAAAIILDEFRAGKIGRITLELPSGGT